MADQQANSRNIKLLDHPTHPMVLLLPVTLYTAAMVCYLAYNSNADALWFKVGYIANLAGICMAALGALPGVIDWLGIPNNTRAKRVGAGHLALNVVSLALFTANYFKIMDQWNVPNPDMKHSLTLSIAGFVLMLGAGFLGWTMVHTYRAGMLREAGSDTKPYQEQPKPTFSSRGTGSTLSPAKDKNRDQQDSRESTAF